MVPLAHAFEAGQVSVEHLTGFLAAVKPDGSPYDLEQWFFRPDGVKAVAALGRGDFPANQVFSEEKLHSVAAAAASSHTWNVPTLVNLRPRSVEIMNAASRSAEMRYMLPATRAMWAERFVPGMASFDADTTRGMSILFAQSLLQVAALHAAGAGILAGTDTPNLYVFPGSSLHDELSLMVKAGLSPYEALRTATAAPADFMSERGKFGTVVEGARADLVLLDADPLIDIGNTRRIAGVLVDGRWLSAADLQQRLKRVATEWVGLENRFAGLPPLTSNSEAAAPAPSIWVRLLQGTHDIGAERFVAPRLADGARRVYVQELLGAPGTRAGRSQVVELDKNQRLRRYELNGAGRRDAGQSIVLENTGDSEWTIRNGAATHVEKGTCDVIITATAADAAILEPLLTALPEGETRTLAACRVSSRADGRIVHETWSVHREPWESVVVIGLITGGNRYHVTVTTELGKRDERIWIGGGFFVGEFLRGEATNEHGTFIRRERIR